MGGAGEAGLSDLGATSGGVASEMGEAGPRLGDVGDLIGLGLGEGVWLGVQGAGLLATADDK